MNGNQDNTLILIAGQLAHSKSKHPDSLARALETLNNQPRILHFPPSSVGSIYLHKKDPEKNYLNYFTHLSFFSAETADQVLEAQGTMTIPGNNLVGLRVKQLNQDTLKCLSQLGANALDALSFFGHSLLTNELEFIENLRDLRLLTLSDTNISDQSFAFIKAFPKLEKLYLTGTNVTDLGLEVIKNLPALQHFRLLSDSERNFPITDKTLTVLGGLENLKIIFLENTEITDQGLAALTNLKQLWTLSLGDNQLSDDSTEFIKEIKSLSLLRLCNTKLTDKSVKNLAQLPNLFLLDLSGTAVSEEAVVWLYERLPRCVHILWNGGAYPTLEELTAGFTLEEDIEDGNENENENDEFYSAELKEEEEEEEEEEIPQPENAGPIVLGWWPT